MHFFVVGALATAVFAHRGHGRKGGMWWGAAPECAQSCLSSVYEEEATITSWPGPDHFCTATAVAPLSSCLSESCTATPTAWTSLSSLSESLCSVYASCTSDSTAVFTLTRPTDTNDYGYGKGPWRTYTGDGTITVTGCPTYGFGMHGGFGPYGGWTPWGGERPDDAFWGWGYGWSSLTTYTEVATTTITLNGTTTESLVTETLAMAVTDGTTTTSTVGSDGSGDATATGEGSQQTASDGDNDEDPSAGNVNELTVLGAALAAVVAIAGLL